MPPKTVIVPKTYKTPFFIMIGFVVVLTIILLYTIFARKEKVDRSQYDALNNAYNEVLKIRSEERLQDSLSNEVQRKQAEVYKEGFEYYRNLANKNLQFYKDNEKKFRSIPDNIKPISNKDSLRAAAKKFD